jgi:hypothetical protein
MTRTCSIKASRLAMMRSASCFHSPSGKFVVNGTASLQKFFDQKLRKRNRSMCFAAQTIRKVERQLARDKRHKRVTYAVWHCWKTKTGDIGPHNKGA